MTDKCTICGNELGEAYRCPVCGFDRRGDFVGLRAVSLVGKRDLYEHMVRRAGVKLVQDGDNWRAGLFQMRMAEPH